MGSNATDGGRKHVAAIFVLKDKLVTGIRS